MSAKKIIYIIGFMGCGKTTTGRKLAADLDWNFIDLDRKIEEHTGKTIPEIFSLYGEEYFRLTESQVLKSLGVEKNVVISTGGGTPCFGDNMDFMLDAGLTVYLKMTPAGLKERLSHSTGKRPLIAGIPLEGLQDFIEQKLSSREKWYNRAEIHIETNDLENNILSSLVKQKLDQ